MHIFGPRKGVRMYFHVLEGVLNIFFTLCIAPNSLHPLLSGNKAVPLDRHDRSRLFRVCQKWTRSNKGHYYLREWTRSNKGHYYLKEWTISNKGHYYLRDMSHRLKVRKNILWQEYFSHNYKSKSIFRLAYHLRTLHLILVSGLTPQYTSCTDSVRSNHCFQTIVTYRK